MKADMEAGWENVIKIYEMMEMVEHNEFNLLDALFKSGGEASIAQNVAMVHARGKGGETMLMSAAWRGHTDIVKLLVELKSNPNLRKVDGWTALMLASERGHLGCVKALVKAGSDISMKTNVLNKEKNRYVFSTAVDLAETNSHESVVKYLKGRMQVLFFFNLVFLPRVAAIFNDVPIPSLKFCLVL